MSRLGKSAVSVPDKVEIKSDKTGYIQIKGPKGSLDLQLPKGLSLKTEGKELFIERDEKECNSAFHGLYRSLLNNCVIGVSAGYEKRLTMIGVGYRAAVKGTKIDLQVGYSHPTELEIPKSLEIEIEKGTRILIKGIDKQKVGQFAANIRSTRPPEPYKGKGIRYENEFVRKKEGKAAKGKA